jgi:hypothetical protein
MDRKQPTPKQAYAAAKRAEARAWKALKADWTIENKRRWGDAVDAMLVIGRMVYGTPPATGQKVNA